MDETRASCPRAGLPCASRPFAIDFQVNDSELKPASPPLFLTTHWTVVLNAARPDSEEALAALAELCRTYWFPLYAYARRHGFDLHNAQDLTQDFFGRLIEKNYLSVADRRRGRFRWFLLTAFKCFLANEWDRSQAQKRGGGKAIISFDAMTAEERYRAEPADHSSADQVYDRRWAADLLEGARAKLREEYTTADRADRFHHLEAYLPGGQPALSQAEVGAALGLAEGTVKQEVFRVRRRYGELLRQAVAQTVAHPDEVDDEINYLIDVMSRR
jgi:DNA-directed RNA polymerase specialized sigma24 family protein